jgi:hypothetical protein
MVRVVFLGWICAPILPPPVIPPSPAANAEPGTAVKGPAGIRAFTAFEISKVYSETGGVNKVCVISDRSPYLRVERGNPHHVKGSLAAKWNRGEDQSTRFELYLQDESRWLGEQHTWNPKEEKKSSLRYSAPSPNCGVVSPTIGRGTRFGKLCQGIFEHKLMRSGYSAIMASYPAFPSGSHFDDLG